MTKNNLLTFLLMLSILMNVYYIFKSRYNIEKTIEKSDDLLLRLMRETKNQKEKLKYDISHLTQSTQIVWCSVQDDEALLLYGLVKSLRPKTIVEFGMGRGASSLNFLKALDDDAKIYCYDIQILNENAKSFEDKRFEFIHKSQTKFNPNDFDNRIIDLAFLDNGHIFDIEIELFPKLIKQMSPTGVIIVHDTGLHVDDIIRGKCVCEFPDLCGIMHVQAEREFVNWIGDNYPEWQIISIHSFNQYRHGLTILQRKFKFNLTEVDKSNCRFDHKGSKPIL